MTKREDIAADTLTALVVKIPPFWAADPIIWISQVDSQLEVATVKTENEFLPFCGRAQLRSGGVSVGHY